MGEMPQYFAAADYVFMGGSLIPHGGQNMLEPAAMGKPEIFGPHVHNFPEPVEILLKSGGALQVKDPAELAARLEFLIEEPAESAKMAFQAREAVLRQQGAALRTAQRIMQIARDFKLASPS